MQPRHALFAIACATALIASPVSALTPLPAGHVSDAEALRLLREVYREKATLKGEWPASATARSEDEIAPSSRTICADSGATHSGPRRIAVCTSFADAGHAHPGEVDLFLLLDPRSKQKQARIGASERGVQTGGWGTPGDVSFFEVGPGRAAFALDSAFTNMGWTVSSRSLYHAESDRFESLLTVGTGRDNTGVCDPDEDRACRRKSVALDCKLVANRSGGGTFHPLDLVVTGERAGKPVKRTIAIPYRDGAYRPSAALLQKEGCDEGV
ncbi:MAG: hypothetical protein V4673_17580 [Pseudomonadota bacterium]